MNVAFIPVRGGSKSIPLKNIKLIGGKPLVYWSMKAASECKYIDKIYISTDSIEIKDAVENIKKCTESFENVEVIGRSKESATDTASTEFVMLEFAEKYGFNNIVLIQATSPLLTSRDLENGFEIFQQESTDSVLSVVRQKRFNWTVDENDFAIPANYDVFHRPRRQEFDGYLVENGAFYITSRKHLIESKNRISGNIRACEMDESTYYEIDEPSDWIIIEQQLLKREQQIKNKPEIKMFLTDCDGCLTDGGMYYSENGDELKKFNTKDGMGFRLLKERGILSGVITGEDVELNRRRAEKLRLDIYKSGVKDKLSVINQLCEEYGIALDNVAYVGDDINDLEVLKVVGFGCSVADAMDCVKASAKYVTKRNGGNGAIREIIDLLLS